jgi:hypothetical protein
MENHDVTRTLRYLCWMLVLAGALASLRVASSRWSSETANRAVEIVVDWDEVRGLAEVTGTPTDEALRLFYAAGARGLAIGEDTLASLQAVRRIELLPPTTPGITRIRVSEALLFGRIAGSLRAKWGIEAVAEGDVLSVPVAWTDLAGLGIGLPADVVTASRKAGLEPVARILNFEGAQDASITAVARDLGASMARLVIFGGDQVLGYPDGLKATAAALPAHGLVYGQVEFGKQKGEDALARLLKGAIVRVHSVSPTDMGRLSEAEATDRFVRAAEERNIRALYVRLLPGAQVPPFKENLRYVNGIAAALKERGFPPGLAQPFRAWDSHAALRAVIGLGVAAATVLLVEALLTLGPWLSAALVLLAAFDALAPAMTLGRKVVALQASVVFPVLAMTLLRARWENHAGGQASLARTLLSPPVLGRFVCVSLLSLLGALAIIGLLSSRMASMKLLEFSGIKLQQIGTLLAVAAIYALEVEPRGGWKAETAHMKRRFGEIWSQPVALGGLLATVVALVALALLLARSGNDPGVGVSPLEMRFRAALDQVLGVRPRTKEFLIGHPALLFGIALALMRRPRWAVPLLVIGAIGQAGMVNTFCHLHTPLAVSVMRTLNGVWVAVLLAAAAALIVDALGPRGHRDLADRIPTT